MRGTIDFWREKFMSFLRKERIELACHSFELSVYASSAQCELFPTQMPSIKGSISNLIASGKVSSEILVRARRLLEEAKADLSINSPNRLAWPR